MKGGSKKNSFKIPKGYFEEFTGNLLGQLAETDALPTNKGFNVPDGYFDNLNKQLLHKINNKKEETTIVQLHSYRKYYYAVASIAAILLVFFGIQKATKENITFESLASSDIEQYFETTDLELTSLEIAELLPMDELEINDFLTNQLNEENIIQYLDANVEDVEDLNLENDE